ncbi:MAG: hypothetical protein AAFZ02_02100 [Pseudomonadota bacterium]
MDNTKVATCCYCGTRAALVLRGTSRHELACSSCGAPLHDLKMLPKRKEAKGSKAKPPKPSKPSKREYYEGYSKPWKTKKKKSLGRKIFSEIFDVIEDIID